MSQTIRINNGQTLIDAAVQHLGDASLVVQSAIENNISITEEVTQATLEDADVSAQKTVEQMNKPYNIPASDDGTVQPEGIDFWRIGIDFKTSPTHPKDGLTEAN